jgi:predicted ATP-grasp superfamily ATP-dependent carboligase
VRVLLVDQSRDRATLVAARSLGQAGFEVGTGAWQPSLAATSRYAGRHHPVRECEEDEDGFVDDIAGAVAEGGYGLVFCSYDVGLLTLSRRREEIAPAVWPYAGEQTVWRAFDKLELARGAEAAGLAAPRTELAGEATLAAWDGPVVVKARSHAPKRFPTHIYASAAEGRELVHEIQAQGGEALLQEPMSGHMGAVVLLVDRDGETLVELHQEAVRTWPPEAGDTVRGRFVARDPELSAGMRRLARDLGWFGLVQVEYVRDASGVAQVTDFNGRFYGSMALATGAGVNLPALWAQLALGGGRPAAPRPRRTAGFQWLNRDLPAARAHGTRALLGAVAAAPVASHSMWSVRDPWPALRYLLPEAFRRLRSRLFGGGAD